MRSLILLGGLIGFGIGVGFGLMQGKTMPSIMLHACVATYASGMLLRWWGRVWIRNVQQANQERHHG
jgi:ribose/xylose/arabinose/galactoside ABC-type transport system permease subunit